MSDTFTDRQLAENSRQALALLGYHIEPRCLPGEPDACGGTDLQHVIAHLYSLAAVVSHHISHVPEDPAFGAIFEQVTGDLEAGCEGPTTRGEPRRLVLLNPGPR